MIQKNPRYKVMFAHTNSDATCFGNTETLLMEYKAIEMMLRFINPLKSVNWCKEMLSLSRHSFMTITNVDTNECGNKTFKVLRIERN